MEIWNAAGNEKMKMLLSNMWNGLSMGHKVTEEQYAGISIQEHKGILEALEKMMKNWPVSVCMTILFAQWKTC